MFFIRLLGSMAGGWRFRWRLVMRCWTHATTLPAPLCGKWSPTGSSGRWSVQPGGPTGAGGELMCRRRAKAMRRRALHAALRRSSFGHEVAVAGRAAGAWELVRRDERRPGGLGRLVGQPAPRGHRSTLPRPPEPSLLRGLSKGLRRNGRKLPNVSRLRSKSKGL